MEGIDLSNGPLLRFHPPLLDGNVAHTRHPTRSLIKPNKRSPRHVKLQSVESIPAPITMYSNPTMGLPPYALSMFHEQLQGRFRTDLFHFHQSLLNVITQTQKQHPSEVFTKDILDVLTSDQGTDILNQFFAHWQQRISITSSMDEHQELMNQVLETYFQNLPMIVTENETRTNPKQIVRFMDAMKSLRSVILALIFKTPESNGDTYDETETIPDDDSITSDQSNDSVFSSTASLLLSLSPNGPRPRSIEIASPRPKPRISPRIPLFLYCQQLETELATLRQRQQQFQLIRETIQEEDIGLMNDQTVILLIHFWELSKSERLHFFCQIASQLPRDDCEPLVSMFLKRCTTDHLLRIWDTFVENTHLQEALAIRSDVQKLPPRDPIHRRNALLSSDSTSSSEEEIKHPRRRSSRRNTTHRHPRSSRIDLSPLANFEEDEDQKEEEEETPSDQYKSKKPRTLRRKRTVQYDGVSDEETTISRPLLDRLHDDLLELMNNETDHEISFVTKETASKFMEHLDAIKMRKPVPSPRRISVLRQLNGASQVQPLPPPQHSIHRQHSHRQSTRPSISNLTPEQEYLKKIDQLYSLLETLGSISLHTLSTETITSVYRRMPGFNRRYHDFSSQTYHAVGIEAPTVIRAPMVALPTTTSPFLLSPPRPFQRGIVPSNGFGFHPTNQPEGATNIHATSHMMHTPRGMMYPTSYQMTQYQHDGMGKDAMIHPTCHCQHASVGKDGVIYPTTCPPAAVGKDGMLYPSTCHMTPCEHSVGKDGMMYPITCQHDAVGKDGMMNPITCQHDAAGKDGMMHPITCQHDAVGKDGAMHPTTCQCQHTTLNKDGMGHCDMTQYRHEAVCKDGTTCQITPYHDVVGKDGMLNPTTCQCQHAAIDQDHSRTCHTTHIVGNDSMMMDAVHAITNKLEKMLRDLVQLTNLNSNSEAATQVLQIVRAMEGIVKKEGSSENRMMENKQTDLVTLLEGLTHQIELISNLVSCTSENTIKSIDTDKGMKVKNQSERTKEERMMEDPADIVIKMAKQAKQGRVTTNTTKSNGNATSVSTNNSSKDEEDDESSEDDDDEEDTAIHTSTSRTSPIKAPVIQGKKLFHVAILLRVIDQMYREHYEAMSSSLAYGNRRMEFSEFMYDWHIRKYGLKSLAQQHLLKLIESLRKYENKVFQCRLCLRFLGIINPLGYHEHKFVLGLLDKWSGGSFTGASKHRVLHAPRQYKVRVSFAISTIQEALSERFGIYFRTMDTVTMRIRVLSFRYENDDFIKETDLLVIAIEEWENTRIRFEQILEAVYTAGDLNGDKSLEYDEFSFVMFHLSPGLNPTFVQRLFQTAHDYTKPPRMSFVRVTDAILLERIFSTTPLAKPKNEKPGSNLTALITTTTTISGARRGGASIENEESYQFKLLQETWQQNQPIVDQVLHEIRHYDTVASIQFRVKFLNQILEKRVDAKTGWMCHRQIMREIDRYKKLGPEEIVVIQRKIASFKSAVNAIKNMQRYINMPIRTPAISSEIQVDESQSSILKPMASYSTIVDDHLLAPGYTPSSLEEIEAFEHQLRMSFIEQADEGAIDDFLVAVEKIRRVSMQVFPLETQKLSANEYNHIDRVIEENDEEENENKSADILTNDEEQG